MYLNNTLFRTAQLWPERLAIDTETRQATWRETLDRVRRLASSLAELCAEPEDRIGILALNSAEYVELTLAIPLTGHPMVTMNYRLSHEELLQMLRDCPVRVLAFDAAMAETVAALRPHLDCRFLFMGPASGAPAFAEPFEALVQRGHPIDPPLLAPSDIWAIVPSGGTTGVPKAIALSHGAMAFTIAATVKALDLGPEPRCLHVSPLFHLAGFTANYAITANGGTHAFLPQFSVDGLLTSLARHRSTMTNLVPTMISWLVAREDLADYDLSALRTITYGAAAINLPTLRKLVELFPHIRLTQFYGQTEACGALSCLLADDHGLEPGIAHRLRSAGRPLPGVRVEIMDPDGRILPRNEAGEICAMTDALFSRYVGYEDLTRGAVRAGWLRTGDIGYLDDDGFLYVTDRLKDMIVTGGENVSASEVENVLATHPDVVQVAVVAAPDDVWGEKVHAFVVVGGTSAVLEADLDQLCRARLATYKIPRSYTLQTEPLPLTGAGKIMKTTLRATFKVPSAT